MNQVGLVGRTTKDLVLRQLSDKKAQTSFVVAVNRNFRNNQGGIDADFVLCVAWGKLAERIVRYCGKGSLIGINGRLHSRTYINKANQKVYTTEVVVEDVRFYSLKSRGNDATHQLVTSDNVPEHFTLPDKEAELPILQI
ncbi:single-stranded DNA-binding protein [Solibacillus sp. FSL H8-0538]|uniref:single-stranded DNA-binding protein n=1 Tax=Solibacillus sp. FSL H8-0538 TaxID=2921400 RepID=UPI0030FA3CCC